MGWANEFIGLTNEMFKEHQDRDGYIRQLKGDIKQKKNDWNAMRTQMKAELLTSFKEWDKARAKEVAEIRSMAQAYLKNFRDEDIVRFKRENKERAQQMAKFMVDVGKMISGFKKDRDQAAAAWKELMTGLVHRGEKKAPAKKETSRTKTTRKAKKA